jgi:hypothetical protein
MKSLITLLVFSTVAFGQSTISGTLYANNVIGFIIIGCLLDSSTQDCNYDQSPYTEITQSGTSSAYTLRDAPAGQYLIIAWKDTNANGNLDEDADEIGYYVSSDGQPGLITPPMQQVDIWVELQPMPAASQGSSQHLVGSWSNYGNLSQYLNNTTTTQLNLESSVARTFVFNADGTYSSLFYNENYDDVTDSYGPCIWKRVRGIYQTQDNALVTEIQSEEFAVCGLELKPVEITNPLEQFIWRIEEDGIGLLDVTELQNVDESYWTSGYAYHVTNDVTNSNASPAANPLTQTPSQNPLTNNQNNSPDTHSQGLESSIIGSWSTSSYFGDYVDASSGAYLADAQSAHGVTFNGNGTYQMLDYYNLNGSCQWFRYSGTYQVQSEKIIAQPQQSEMSVCGGAFTNIENTTQEFFWRFVQYDDGMKLELLPVSSYRDERDWFYAYRYANVGTRSPAITRDISIIGTWSDVSTNGVDFYNPTTGAWAAPSGDAMEMTLYADGTCEIYGLLQNSLYSSTIRIFIAHAGTYTFDGTNLIVTGTSRIYYDNNGEIREETTAFNKTYRLSFSDANTMILDGDFTLSRK